MKMLICLKSRGHKQERHAHLYHIKMSDIHSHNIYQISLNSKIFMSPRVRSNYGKETFKFAVTKIWEKIPTNMKTLTLLHRKLTLREII